MFKTLPMYLCRWKPRSGSKSLLLEKSFSIPYFDPITLNQQDMVFRVTDSEILENGEEAWWIQSSFGGMVTRTLIDANGTMLRQEGGAMGLSVVRMSPEQAQDIPLGGDDVDLIALSAVPFGKLSKSQDKTSLVVDVSGVDAQKISHQPPLQIIENQVTCHHSDPRRLSPRRRRDRNHTRQSIPRRNH